MNPNVQWTCNELISALVECGAQGAVVTGLIWGALNLCPRANAATRHGAWFATLLVVAFLPAAHFVGALQSKLNESLSAPAPIVSESATSTAEIEVDKPI